MIGDERKRLQTAINEALWPPHTERTKLVFEAAQAHCNTLPKGRRRVLHATVTALMLNVKWNGIQHNRAFESVGFDIPLDTMYGELENRLRCLNEDGATNITVTIREGWVDQ